MGIECAPPPKPLETEAVVMETVIESSLGILITLTLSGCLTNAPPGVERVPPDNAAKLAAIIEGSATWDGSTSEQQSCAGVVNSSVRIRLESGDPSVPDIYAAGFAMNAIVEGAGQELHRGPAFC
ncbi:MAG: hypothetical protein GY842_21510 [bacterium]|nr:hypothetical protein [bacterium]